MFQQQLKLLQEQDALLQRRWSEYADLRAGADLRSAGAADGAQPLPFLRSASARLPRRYRGAADEDSDEDRDADGRSSGSSNLHYQQRRNSASGDRKVQQVRRKLPEKAESSPTRFTRR